MKGKYLRKLGSLVLTLLVLPGVVALFSSTTAEAQRRVIIVPRYRVYRPWGLRPWGWGYDPYFDYYSRYGHYVFNSSESAYSQGYQEGLKTGSKDSKDRKSYSPERSHYYQEAGFGNFGEPFRSGFVRGYAVGYRS